MTEASEDKQEKLNKIWDAWNIATDATGKELWKALPAVEEWLLTGVSSPVVALRAAQILLLDPERPDSHKHACWSALKKVLRTVLGPGPIEQQHLLAGQALVLAAWPSTAHDGHFPLVPLLDSAWDVAVGRQRQQEELLPWRIESRCRAVEDGESDKASSVAISRIGLPTATLDIKKLDNAIRHISDNGNGSVWTNTAAALTQLKEFAVLIGLAIGDVPNQVRDVIEGSTVLLKDGSFSRWECQSKMVWWGQARYCHSLQKPFRRIEPREDALWWAAYEAAELSIHLEVEPASAYLVETIHALGHDILEKRPLLEWMNELHRSLARVDSQIVMPKKQLADFVNEDALGLPVTWTRLRAVANEPLTGAEAAIALDLTCPIDRGQWASWVFREVLLDRRLAGGV